MKIKLLGTAAFEGIPALFCGCDICKESKKLKGRNIRKRTSALLDNKIAFDFTNDTLSHVSDYDLDLANLEHLFITHSHSDHFNYYDLEAKLKWYTDGGNPVLNVYANKVCVDKAKTFLDAIGDIKGYINFVEVTHFSKIEVGNYTITPLPARHITDYPDEKACIYIIEHNGKKILYGLDSGWYYEETWEYLESIHLDCLVLDCTFGIYDSEVGNHMCLNENIKVIERLMNKQAIDNNTILVATHFSHNGKVVYDKHFEVLKEQGILMSHDGIEIDV